MEGVAKISQLLIRGRNQWNWCKILS